jgi:hypothetical protein
LIWVTLGDLGYNLFRRRHELGLSVLHCDALVWAEAGGCVRRWSALVFDKRGFCGWDTIHLCAKGGIEMEGSRMVAESACVPSRGTVNAWREKMKRDGASGSLCDGRSGFRAIW